MKKYKYLLNSAINALNIVILIATIITGVAGSLYMGYVLGYNDGVGDSQKSLDNLLANLDLQVSSQEGTDLPEPTPQVVYIDRPQSTKQVLNWSGPDLWGAVNKRRVELGVSGLGNRPELCTIASIRLNELLELGKLDGHEGFSTLPERREDLKWIFEKYNISEFLVSGAGSATEAVNLWENTLGHKKLLTGGEYVWGCTYAQNSFGVAIAAY